jgi:NADH:ubiquinone oxidoreductase subunit 2 (subunit N)
MWLINAKKTQAHGTVVVLKRCPILHGLLWIRLFPWIGFFFTLGLLSIAGIPPMAGFFGKYMVFSHAFKMYPELVIIAVINSGIGIYYYLKIFMTFMASDHTEESNQAKPNVLQYIVLAICAIGLIAGPFVLM